MTQDSEGLPDSPEARSTLLHTRHIVDWSIVQMECARLFALGLPEPEIARRAGITQDEVQVEFDYFVGRIFIVAGWKSLDTHGAISTWLYLHKDCCIPKWEQEVASTDPSELPAELAEHHRELPRWKRWDDAARLRDREDPRAPSVRRKPPRRER